MKKIALFGGTGYVGSRLLDRLLAAGYSVRMLVRDSSKVEGLKQRSGVEVVEGAIEDLDHVLDTVHATDACMVVTGARTQSREDMWDIVTGTRNVIAAMEQLGVNRLIKLSGTSVRVEGEDFPLMRRFLDWGLKLAMPNPTRSKYLEHQDIFASSLEWVLVRPPVIAPKPIKGVFAASESDYLGLKVYRDDLCDFMIEQLETDIWVRKAPTLGYR